MIGRLAVSQPLISILQFRFLLCLALALVIAGCTPAGPRALLKGKKLLEDGDYAGAVAELKTATKLLGGNAQAWNYLGVACQHSGQATEAVAAYQRALALDRDLMEAHYNLGCLWLEQNKPDAAKMEFIAYTLRRPNAIEGWLKLGSAQLRTGETVPAEKSFSTVRAFDTNNAEALNGLGLARIQRERPREAAQFFSAAVQFHPGYAPAYLNLAALHQQYLHDNKTALDIYKKYLALSPRPANWDEANAAAKTLEQAITLAAAKPASAEPKPVPPPKPATVTHVESNPPPPAPAQVVQVPPEPAIVATPTPTPVPAPPPTVQTTAPPATLPVELNPPPEPEKKPGFLHKINPVHWFGTSKPDKKYDENGVTPLPGPSSTTAPKAASAPKTVSSPATSLSQKSPREGTAPKAAATPAKNVSTAPADFSHYVYSSPRKPKAGNRTAAAGVFTQAQLFEQDSRWLEAMKAYQQAAEFDPSWFEAQYNFGVLSARLQDFPQALAAYELALADAPNASAALGARYQFGLTLKSAGYLMDALNEFRKVLAQHPDAGHEAGAHLALGNIYAQDLHDPAHAREHYLKVLELDPQNPQATEIRFWLAANP